MQGRASASASPVHFSVPVITSCATFLGIWNPILNQGVVEAVAQPHRPSQPGQCVLTRRDQAKSLWKGSHHFNAGRCLSTQAQPDVNLAVGDPMQDLFAAAGAHGGRDARMTLHGGLRDASA